MNNLEYETVEQHYGYNNPKDLLLRQNNDLQLLDTCAITPSLLEKLQDKIENVSTGHYIDMSVSSTTTSSNRNN